MKNEVRLIDANALVRDHGEDVTNWDRPYAVKISSIEAAPAIDPESLRPKGRWEIQCEYHRDNWTGEVDEEFYLECSECKRQVWDVDQMAAMNDDHQKLIEKYPYCHCGCKMEGTV